MRFPAGQGGAFTRAVCLLLFVALAFCYLCFYQDSLVAAALRLLTGGRVSVHRVVAALAAVALLAALWAATLRLYKGFVRSSALSFLPETFLLTVLTSFGVTADGRLSCGCTLYISMAAAVLSVAALAALDRRIRHEAGGRDIPRPLKSLWINTLIMPLLFMFVCLFSNGDAVLHARLRMEQYLEKGEWERALAVAKRADKPDEGMTMLTAYALSRVNMLPEQLFEYAVQPSSRCLLPHPGGVRCVFVSEEEILRHAKTAAAADYSLCGLLVDKRLDRFAEALAASRRIDSSLPKHYREALILYVHSRSNPKTVFRNSVGETDYQDYLRMERSIADGVKRRNRLRGVYGNTYWYYFDYIEQPSPALPPAACLPEREPMSAGCGRSLCYGEKYAAIPFEA